MLRVEVRTESPLGFPQRSGAIVLDLQESNFSSHGVFPRPKKQGVHPVVAVYDIVNRASHEGKD